jgi:hypothetical protein
MTPLNKPMVRGAISKLIFIDSSVATHGDHTKVLVPPHPLSAGAGERMALSLVSFSMRRNWYNANPTNNTFYIFTDNTYHKVEIVSGVYPTFASLTTAINAALTATISAIATIASVATTYSATTRKFTIVFTMASGSEAVPVEIRCFAIKTGSLPANVSLQGGFNDSFEILGAKPNRSTTAETSMEHTPDIVNGTNTLTSIFPASLNTLDAVYLRINSVETGNFMSTGFNSRIRESDRLIESQIFARIPFARSSFDEVHEVVSFEDNGGDQYQSFLLRKSLDTLDIQVTDAKGRSLAQVDPSQADEGLMAFKMCLRWDLFVPPKPPPPEHKLAFEKPPTI